MSAIIASKPAAGVLAGLFCLVAFGFSGRAAEPDRSARASQQTAAPDARLDRSGRKRVGKASFYAKKFSGRKMADGSIMESKDNNAASKTLPLGTIAKVTNLENGKSAVVTIEDRGPYVRGRIVDLSPRTAQTIGISPKQGVAKVEVAPIAVPLPGGGVKLGAAATADDAKHASGNVP